MFTVDAALQHTCASFREQAELGRITATECDLLVDGAIMLALHLEALAQDGLPAPGESAPQAARPYRLAA